MLLSFFLERNPAMRLVLNRRRNVGLQSVSIPIPETKRTNIFWKSSKDGNFLGRYITQLFPEEETKEPLACFLQRVHSRGWLPDMKLVHPFW